MTHEDRLRILRSYGTLYLNEDGSTGYTAVILVSVGNGSWKSNGRTIKHATNKMYAYIQKFMLKQIP
jgi:hypothetical protein